MADYIRKIKTAEGNKQIDYEALANLPVSDTTLSESGKFADAKAVGDAISPLQNKTNELDEKVTELESKAVQSDYTENDETAASYIKNRPFYTTDPMDTVLVEETTITEWYGRGNGLSQNIDYNNPDDIYKFTDEGFYQNYVLRLDRTYKVFWDGTEYELVCKLDDSDQSYYIGSLDFSECPFVIFNLGNSLDVAISKTEAISTTGVGGVEMVTGISHTVKVTTLAPHCIQIDESYIPDTIARASRLESLCKTSVFLEHQSTLTYNGVNYYSNAGKCYIYFLTTEGLWLVYFHQDPSNINFSDSNFIVRYNSSSGAITSYKKTFNDDGSFTENAINIIYAILYDVHTNRGIIRIVSGQSTLTIGEYKKITGNIPIFVDGIRRSLYQMHSFDDTLPVVTEEDNGKIVKVVDGSWSAADETQSDWNQNDENASDYIKNRPFYTTDPVDTQILSETTIEGFGNGDNSSYICRVYGNENLSSGLIPGETYSVIWDGVEYNNLICFSNGDGDPTIGAPSGDYSVYPFCFCTWLDMQNVLHMEVQISSSEGDDPSLISHTISVIGHIREIVLLDEKYISYKPGLKVENRTFNINGVEHIADEGSEIFNDYANNKATGLHSHAEGCSTTASGYDSHAEGGRTTASGNGGSHAEGSGTTASGDGSHAEGSGTTASGFYSHAEGNSTTASGDCSHAEGGFDVNKVLKLFVSGDVGSTTYQLSNSIDESYEKILKGANVIFGYVNARCTAVTKSNGKITHFTLSTSLNPTTAITDKPFSFHIGSIAAGSYSHAEGENTVAASNNQHTQGRYNNIDTKGKYAHIVGNGTSASDRSNAHVLDWDGNAEYAGDVIAQGCGGETPISLIELKNTINQYKIYVVPTSVSTPESLYNWVKEIGSEHIGDNSNWNFHILFNHYINFSQYATGFTLEHDMLRCLYSDYSESGRGYSVAVTGVIHNNSDTMHVNMALYGSQDGTFDNTSIYAECTKLLKLESEYDNLTTTDKTILGAINELSSSKPKWIYSPANKSLKFSNFVQLLPS